ALVKRESETNCTVGLCSFRIYTYGRFAGTHSCPSVGSAVLQPRIASRVETGAASRTFHSNRGERRRKPFLSRQIVRANFLCALAGIGQICSRFLAANRVGVLEFSPFR